MTEKICLITGATDGIGKATAIKLAAAGYRVVIVARNPKKALSLVHEITDNNPTAKLDYLIADLSSLTQVNEMLMAFKSKYRSLDVLINNAGVVMPKAAVTEDGFEMTFQVNYLSPFFITNALLGHLLASGAGRIINVISNLYALGKFDLGGVKGGGRYNAINVYAATKLYLLMYTEELARRINGGGVTANSMHPGIVRTNMSTQVQGFPFVFRLISAIAMPFAIAPEKAAVIPLLLATSDSVAGITGKYFANSKVAKTKSKFNTAENRRELWDFSEKIWESYNHPS